MDFTRHTDFSSIQASAWNALLETGITDVPFLRYEVLRQWWQTRGGGEWQQAELALISASEGGQLIGIAPLFKAEHDGRPALLLAGSIEISDYLDLIVRAEHLPPFLSGLLEFIVQDRHLAGLPLDWYNLPAASPTLAALQAAAEQRGWTYQAEVYRPAPYVALNGDFEAYLARLDKKQRHEIRRKLRRAAESELPMRFYIVDEKEALEAEMEDLFQLMSQDPRKARFLTPAMRTHLRALAHIAFEHGYLWLAFLTVNGLKIAAAFNFDYRNKLWGYNSGVHSDFRDLSPGWVLLAHQLRWACEQRRREFDFMRGDEEYKYRFGGINRYVMRAVLTPPSSR